MESTARRHGRSVGLFCRAAWLAALGVAASVTGSDAGPVTVPGTGSSEWHRFRGPNYDGVTNDSAWSADWGPKGPAVLWEKDVATGYSGMAISGGRVYTMGTARRTDRVQCLKLDSGETVWAHEYGCGGGGHPGPRVTPTVAGKRVYTFSREGHVFCLDADTGKVVWSNSLAKTLRAEPPQWGFASSPLVIGGQVILNAGEAGTALDADTGEVVWSSGREGASYASAVPVKIGERLCAAIFAAKGLVLVDAATGERLWSYRWITSYDVNAADPVIDGNDLFISSGYGRGGTLLRFSTKRAGRIWQNKHLCNHFSSSVLVRGRLYGFSGNMGGGGALNIVDWKTGRRVGTYKGVGLGSLMVAGGRLILLGERGQLAVCEPSAGGLKEIAKAGVGKGRWWTAPALAEGKLLCRNHAGRLVCLDVSPAKGP
jgi:outer membrane protein assembly factor BamB